MRHNPKLIQCSAHSGPDVIHKNIKALASSPHESWDHELCSVADGVDCAVLDDQALEVGQQALQRHHYTPQVRLVPAV